MWLFYVKLDESDLQKQAFHLDTCPMQGKESLLERNVLFFKHHTQGEHLITISAVQHFTHQVCPMVTVSTGFSALVRGI